MQIKDDHCKLLINIKNEWNNAEQDIKLAEQVCSKVVTPAVKELRYAGRRIIDALNCIIADEDKEKIDDFLTDAKFDCMRARHDAIDVATAKMAIDMDLMIKELKYNAILQAYPEFPKLKNLLSELRSKIALSRGNREKRELIYSTVEEADLPNLIKQFNRMMDCEPIMLAIARDERRKSLWNYSIGIVGALIGIVGLIVAYFK